MKRNEQSALRLKCRLKIQIISSIENNILHWRSKREWEVFSPNYKEGKEMLINSVNLERRKNSKNTIEIW